ncbi:hypothetical protein L6164_009089 [Bauhinia variegata]|uniref:Uncharacterized protein n=1 Tax=Bauhinia variegata TaxID=167791 RepID=A0ACB9PIR4_BAUVA|nr:hypothetical protein L6164_009089 [Bauhinia variegata]
MGCGTSTMDLEDETPDNRHSNLLHRNKNARPVGGTKKPLDDNGEESLKCLPKQSRKTVPSPGNKDSCVLVKPEMKGNQDNGIKEKEVVEKQKAEKAINKEETEREENNDREDHIFKGIGSPSFRDYCVDHKPNPRTKKKVRGDPSFSHYFNDDSCESTENEGDDVSTKTMNKPQTVEGGDSNKEPEKKERRGRGLRSVISKGRTGGKKSLANMSCYNSSNTSSAEGSIQKMVGKAA